MAFEPLNLWVWLRWQYTQVPRRGRRWLAVKRFQLFRFVKFLLRALEHHYKAISELEAVAAPRP